jgi:hypothetical protein
MRLTFDPYLKELLAAATWSDFFTAATIGLILLVIAAHLAGIRFGSLPANPLYWHYTVIMRAKGSPIIENRNQSAPTSRLYFYFWATSLCSFFTSALILVALIFRIF